VDATVVSINQKKVLVELGTVHSSQHELSYNVRLYCSLVKREVFETVVKQATELGVREIIPLVSDRTIKTRLNVQRLEKIIREAAEQSERGYVPKLFSPVEFKKSVSESTSSTSKIFLFDRSGLPMYEVLHSNPVAPSSVDVYIGPEGGWSEAELEFIRAYDISIVSFGTTILRTDTAVVAGLLYTRFLH
jgi:16S rRNA (uracil1498-N3)-methyltransferase